MMVTKMVTRIVMVTVVDDGVVVTIVMIAAMFVMTSTIMTIGPISDVHYMYLLYSYDNRITATTGFVISYTLGDSEIF